MSLTPDEIADREFGFGLRGYDQDEVRSFLVEVAGELEHAREGAGSPGDAEIQQNAEAAAEILRARSRAVLAAAQEEAIRLVAEAHVRIDRRAGAPTDPAGTDAPSSTVEAVGETISAMVRVRDQLLEQLIEVRSQVDEAVLVAQADPVLGRPAEQ